jgi:hypothetical protein
MRRALPSQAIVHYWLDYDQFAGIFTWRRRNSSRATVGKQAGTLRRKSGYRLVGLPGFGQVFEHVLAWIYVHGSIPDGMEIDHKDCDPSNNALSNLRLATSSEQKQNRRVQSNNRSGLKGAFYHAAHKGKKWRSQIKVGDQLRRWRTPWPSTCAISAPPKLGAAGRQPQPMSQKSQWRCRHGWQRKGHRSEN